MTDRMSISEKLIWRWNRLQCMSVGEVRYRLNHGLRENAQKLGLFTTESVPAPNLNQRSNAWIKQPTFYLDSQDYCQQADRLLEHGITIFAVKKSFHKIVENWNRDPKTGILAPSKSSPGIDYSDPSVVGDIKYLWEPNRHLFLVPLAQAYQLSRAERYLNAIGQALNQWFDQCSYLKGPNWTSALELAIRLINWSIVWQLIGGINCGLFRAKQGQRFLFRWTQSIYQHVKFISNNLSFYSSANNHLIGELAGIFIATTTWPFWVKFEKFRQQAFNLLENEALQQNAPDGTNREQAIAYQQFVLDFLIMAGLAGQRNHQNFSATYWQRIEKMIEFIGSIMDVNGHIPMIGDADDGYVVALSPEADFCNYRSLLATGAVRFNRQDFRLKARDLDHKTCWIMGKKAVEKFAALNTEPIHLPISRAFKDGGYYILGRDFEKEDEVRCIVHCGPLGYLSIAAHGHAGALALYLTIAGREILIDPGTYLYHGPSKWRQYFRGTAAHCTLAVDDLDQSVSGGKFMWTKHANAQCETWATSTTEDHFVGYHDGYLRFSDPVLHKREVLFDKSTDRITITDRIQCEGPHAIDRFWHFSEECTVDLKNNSLYIENDGIKVELHTPDENSTVQLKKGCNELPSGWISRSFDQKKPSITAVASDTINGTTNLSTIIDIKAISLA